MSETSSNPTVYHTLSDIRARKKALRAELNRDTKNIRTQWDGLFAKPDSKKLPAHRFSQMVSTGVTTFDMLLFAYKLYNRLGNGKRSRGRKRSTFLSKLFG